MQLLLIILFCVRAQATLPPAAQAILANLPGQKLSLQFVVSRGMTSSDSFLGLKAQRDITQSSLLQIQGMLNPRLTAKAGYQDDQREPMIPFMPSRTRGSQVSLGISKLFTTGTALQFDLSHSTSNILLPSMGDLPIAESKLTVGLKQSLWKDAFGYGTRAALDAAAQGSKVASSAVREGRNAWFIGLAELYYGSWLAQSQLLAAEESVARRERLLTTMKNRLRRGTAERPDLLQVESAKAGAEILRAQAKQVLGDRWRLLVTSLKLPPQVADLDPADIPLSLDDPEKEMLASCQNNKPEHAPASVERARAAREAARSALTRAESEKKPGLDLGVNLGTNSVATTTADTFPDLTSFKYPLYGIQLEFSVPLGGFEAEGKRQMAASDLIRAEAGVSQEEDLWKTNWQNSCLELSRLDWSRGVFKQALANQKEREQLEERRFQLGRSTTIQVIQAGDDVSQAQQALSGIETQVRIAAWKLSLMDGNGEKILDAWEKPETTLRRTNERPSQSAGKGTDPRVLKKSPSGRS